MLRGQCFFAGISFAILAFSAPPQSIVNADLLPVHSSSSPNSRVLVSLSRGDAVNIEMVASAADGRWCHISRLKDSSVTGWVPCRRLKEAESASSVIPAAPVVALDPDMAIEEAIRLSGLDKSFAQASDPAIFVAMATQLTPQQIPEYRALVREAARPAIFERAVKDTLRRNYSPELVPVLLEQLRSPLAGRLTKVWAQNTPPDPNAFASFIAELRTAPPSLTRVNLMRRITNAMGTGSATVDVVATIAQSGADALNQATAHRMVTEAQLQQFIGWFRDKYGAALKDAAVSQCLFTLRTVPDEELREYLRLLESDSVRWFNSTVYLGTMYGFQLVMLDLVPEAVEHFSAKRTP